MDAMLMIGFPPPVSDDDGGDGSKITNLELNSLLNIFTIVIVH